MRKAKDRIITVKPKKNVCYTALISSLLSILSFFLGMGLLPYPDLPLFLALSAIILGVTSLLIINKSNVQLKGKAFAIVGIVVSTFVALWCVDAPPISDDYTIVDLRSAPEECEGSYEILASLADKNDVDPNCAPAIGLSASDIVMLEETCNILKAGDYSNTVISQTIKNKAESISQAWQNAEKGRAVISVFDNYPEIADLTETSFWVEDGFTQNLQRLVQIYHLHIFLQSEIGNEEDAIAELLELDSVLRKLSVNARTMITKLVCYAGFVYNINSTNFIANNPNTARGSLEFLAGHFSRLADEQVSLRNAFICEYLMFKDMVEGLTTDKRRLSYLEELHILYPYVSRSAIMLKPNSSLRLYRKYCDRCITASEQLEKSMPSMLSVWPRFCSFMPEVSFDEKFEGILAPYVVPWYYLCYNLNGSVLISLMQPAYKGVIRRKASIQVHDDLWQIVLNQRLGKDFSLKARAYSDEYIIDIEKKLIFSPGPDGKAYTKDDIKLAINPQVLNLTE
jgi:hypothetical protein